MFFQFNAVAVEKTTEEKEAVTVNEQLTKVYNDLYNLDYRKLSIEDFTVYSESLNTLRDLSKAPFCSTPSNTSKVIVFEDSTVYNTAWASCGKVNITESTLENVEATAIRFCYKEGYTDCTIKEHARIVSSKNIDPNTAIATCTVYFDAVVLGKK